MPLTQKQKDKRKQKDKIKRALEFLFGHFAFYDKGGIDNIVAPFLAKYGSTNIMKITLDKPYNLEVTDDLPDRLRNAAKSLKFIIRTDGSSQTMRQTEEQAVDYAKKSLETCVRNGHYVCSAEIAKLSNEDKVIRKFEVKIKGYSIDEVKPDNFVF